jgi:alpha-tubulin suppressor-like RCC1 family protein
MRGARASLLALAFCMVASGIAANVACNSIVGVQDVKLRRDSGASSGTTGDDDDMQQPDPKEPIDSSVAQRPPVLQVAAGEMHSCAKKPEGTVKCWGDDSQGQTGTGGAVADAGVIVSPAAVEGVTDAVDIAAGRSHTCVARKSGKISCWGFNLDGQLGNGGTDKSSTPVDVQSIDNAFLVAAGGSFSCAVRGSGTVACWGNNGHGQLGNGSTSPSLTPVVVQGLSGVIAIAAGQSHACAAKSDGKVFCWGEGVNGQLGNGSTEPKTSPVEVTSLPKSIAVSAGERSSCALTETGAVLCWGANEVGQLGTGAPNDNSNPSPISVSDVTDAIAIASGTNHSCAALKDGTVVCWGAGESGQLGDSITHDTGAAKRVVVSNIKSGFKVGLGAQHSCASTGADEVLCWGLGDRGQLGDGQIGNTNAPIHAVGYP